MEGELFDGRVGMERRSSGTIKEREENARLFGEDTDRLQWTKVDEVKKLVDGCSGGKVANVDGAPGRVVGGGEGCRKSCT